MNEDAATHALALSEHIQENIHAWIRHDFPFLKTDALTHIDESCGYIIRMTIAEQIPVMTASKANERASFLGIPGELRNRIYELLLIPSESSEDADEVCVQYFDRPMWHWHRPERVGSRYLAIAQVSRQTRKESLGIFYGTQVFSAYYDAVGYENQNSPDPRKRDDSQKLTEPVIPHLEDLLPSLRDWLVFIGPERAGQIKRLSLRRTDEVAEQYVDEDHYESHKEPPKYFPGRLDFRPSKDRLARTTRSQLLEYGRESGRYRDAYP